ncbi:profilin-1 isoform 1 [Hibiscus syriacus]|uniref:Complex III subunit II n=2 Tax=Hibiscus syriacus TaxID=106335 RepID=A0A6A2WNK1_HIBSY|nr:mitochondrial-processing peptidase subunit alpha-like isoform X1 [Hibiscus syriacus]KAE8655480.1 profilin-1 isoform 1 [Hibiscus syriacus]
MYRAALSRFRALKGRTGNLAAARFTTSSAVAPLDTPLDGISLPPSLPDYVAPSETKVKTLSNGVRIASEQLPTPAASVGVFVNCGSIYETPISSGASHLLERMAFKSTNRSHLRVVREVEAIGGNTSASASRECMTYTVDALKTYVPEMVELLIDCVRNPAFMDWEVNEEVQKIKAELEEVLKNPERLILEAVHSTGYSGPLANPLLASETAIDGLDSSILEEFVTENYKGNRIVVAASGIENEELLQIAEPLLSDLPVGPQPKEPKSVYVGGDFRRRSDSPSTHFALAFEVTGGWNNEKDSVTLTVMQMLMGGGSSFSAGGPGKGMHSRLYLRVLNEYQQMHSFSAFNSIFNNTGLFGIYGSTSSDFVSKAVDIAAEELILLATEGSVSRLMIKRAQEATKSAVLMNLESRMIVAEDIGRQILTYGERKSVHSFLKMVDEVELQDITNMAKKIISSPLTMASFGEVLQVPNYESVSRKFHAK